FAVRQYPQHPLATVATTRKDLGRSEIEEENDQKQRDIADDLNVGGNQYLDRLRRIGTHKRQHQPDHRADGESEKCHLQAEPEAVDKEIAIIGDVFPTQLVNGGFSVTGNHSAGSCRRPKRTSSAGRIGATSRRSAKAERRRRDL